MNIINFEFKAKVADLQALEQQLLRLDPVFKGEDHQTDTYFNIAGGRLKLREGNIENALIYYEREDRPDAKTSAIILYKHNPDPSLKAMLTKIHGIKIVVVKQRKIYFINNVKFHFDTVDGLGTFIEVEAIGEEGKIPVERLKEQCDHYFSFFGLKSTDYVALSYSDLMK